LAVDDSVTMRKVLEMTFAGEQEFRVVTADGVDTGLTKLRSERPSLVLADATLDGQGGYGLCSRIKAESPGTLVIILSSKQQPYDQAKGTAARADDYIDKPFDTQQLIDKVKKLVLKVVPEPVRQTGAYPSATAAAAFAPPQRPAAAPAAAPPVPGTAGIARPPIGPRPTAPGIAPAAQVGRGTLAYAALPNTPQPGAAAPSPPARPPGPTAAAPQRPAAPAAPAKPPAPAPAPAPAPVVAAPVATNGDLAGKLAGLGLNEAQVAAVLVLSRDLIEKVVWEVVPVLAETIIKEEIKRLTSE
jgi:CheY-like chemotaxis protein